MAWFSGKKSWGNFPDLAGAVNKLQESVKNIEKNFDSALGFEEKAESSDEAAGSWPISTDRNALFNPVMSFMGNKSEESTEEMSEKDESSPKESETEKSAEMPESLDRKPVDEGNKVLETDNEVHMEAEETAGQEENKMLKKEEDGEHTESAADGTIERNLDHGKEEHHLLEMPVELTESSVEKFESSDSADHSQENEIANEGTSESPVSMQLMPPILADNVVEGVTSESGESHGISDGNANSQVETQEESKEERVQEEESVKRVSSAQHEASDKGEKRDDTVTSVLQSVASDEASNSDQSSIEQLYVGTPPNESSKVVTEEFSPENETTAKENESDHFAHDVETDMKEHHMSSERTMSDSGSMIELERVKREMKMMEAALQGAARQAQAKADDIAKLMNENEQLKSVIEDFKRKSNEAEVESLREEYHQRVATLERKVYALTKERDTLRREQSKKSDAAALLKEKDEIITQVMAEGEELSKKQAAQESTIRKLRAQIRDLEEEKKGLTTKLQVEENKVESIKRDKTATEKLLQETIEKHQNEIAAQKEYYTNALAAAKEAEALAEARVNNEARTELESRLREAEERESMLVQALEELRQTLSRKEQQAVFKEDMLLRDIEDLQKRYQASERRCEELITQVPESTRPLLRQIEAMQETNARRAEAWAAVERTLNSRLQEAEAKAATAEERERSVNERLSQTLSRINVLEAQISCLRAEQTQLSKDSHHNTITGFIMSQLNHTQSLRDDISERSKIIKQHEDNLKFLNSQSNQLAESIFDLQVSLAKYHSNNVITSDSGNGAFHTEEETMEQIMKKENTAAGVFSWLKGNAQTSNLTLTKDVVGVVATLGKVESDNLSRILSEFLGLERMLAIVCSSYEGINALEKYDTEGLINCNAGLHGIGSSIGKRINGRFAVISLEDLRPFVGGLVADDPQKKLALPKPRLPNGECPPGFLDYAVNMIHLDSKHLSFLTDIGHGLRETLFYGLFSRLQIYKTRNEMLLALPCIYDGALSLDGGMIQRGGMFALGCRKDVEVKFPLISGGSDVPSNYIETEETVRKLNWETSKLSADKHREQQLLDYRKGNLH